MMRNVKTTLWTALITIVAVLLVGCTASTSATTEEKLAQIESSIQNDSNEVAKVIIDEFAEAYRHINFERKESEYWCYFDGEKDSMLRFFINSDFYDEQFLEIPDMTEITQIPEKFEKMFESAKEKVVAFVDATNLIEEKDKQACKEMVGNTTLVSTTFLGDYSMTPLVTSSDNIVYMNSLLSKHVDQRLLIHELVHILSHVTNSGTKFENSAYRRSLLNEALTEIIASKIASTYNLPKTVIVAYEDLFYYAYCFINKYDMLKTFFYSDGYEEIVQQVGKDKFDMYILAINDFNNNPYVCNIIMTTIAYEFLCTE